MSTWEVSMIFTRLSLMDFINAFLSDIGRSFHTKVILFNVCRMIDTDLIPCTDGIRWSNSLYILLDADSCSTAVALFGLDVPMYLEKRIS